MKRITVRFNDTEEAELQLLGKTFGIDSDSEIIKIAVNWVNSYIKNVTSTFFPQTHNVVLVKKLSGDRLGRRVL